STTGAGEFPRPASIAAIGITNQRETTLLWDRRTGKPVANAIVWQDRRTAPLCDQLRQNGLESLFRERTGLLLDAYFSGTKLAWLLREIPGAADAAKKGDLAFGTVDTWLAWNLTGGRRHITDASNASRTLLYNIHADDWDDDLLRALDIPRAVLPEVTDSSGNLGGVDGNMLPGGPMIGGIAGDQQAALFGQLCLQPGMVKNTYGTGCFMLLFTGDRAPASRNNLLTTVAWRQQGRLSYALEGSVFIAGAVVQWLRDGLGIIGSAPEIEALAASVPDTGGVYLVPAFAGLGAPWWDPRARGTIVGITRGTTRAHIARAALEAIALQVADVLDAMREDAGLTITELRVDGGASANNLLMQIQADLCGIPIARPGIVETTALGAALLAGQAAGVWPDDQALLQCREEDRRFLPIGEARERLARRDQWRRALERARDWAD
ncbi:MAG TPA: glycerol kinase GlpK, partial [Candidatus Hydrogenedentes bacterium]|nr:glycerol kinase GlpK [Candidatus Hydrogenedentota bacterium]